MRMRAVTVLTLLSVVACAAAPGLDSEGGAPRKGKKKGDDPTSQPADTDTETGGEPPSKGDAAPVGGGDQDKDPTPAPSIAVQLSWSSLGDYVYSLDVKPSGGDWIGPCLGDTVIGSATSATFNGVCTSADGVAVPDPAAYRLYYSRSNAGVRHWHDYVEVQSTATNVTFNLPTSAPGKVDLTWNKKSPTAEYSLDVFLMNGEKVRPCYNAGALGTTTAVAFDGACTAPPSYRRVDLEDVSDFVICWAEGGNWGAAQCAGIPYSGFGTKRAIPN